MKKGKEEAKKKKETKKKKSSFDKSTYFMILLILLIVLLLLLVFNKHESTNFKVEKRMNEIAESQKLDTDNYNTIGWIRVEGTKVDHPIIIARNGSFEEPINQASYAWINGKDTKYTNNLTVAGHNYLNLSSTPKKSSKTFERFESLLSYVYYDFAKDNQFIQLTFNNNDYLYQIFAVSFMYNADYYMLPKGDDLAKEDQQKYIDFIKSISIYDYDIKVDSSDKFINVATCTRMFGDDGRTNVVISAKLVPNSTKTKHKVTKTKKYDVVDKKLMGGGENEVEVG